MTIQASARRSRLALIEFLEGRRLLSAAPAVARSTIRDGADLRGSEFQFALEFEVPIAAVPASAIEIVDLANPSVVTNAANVESFEKAFVARAPLNPGTYLLRVKSGNGLVEGVDGQDLDGEYNAPYTWSGDGIAGGDYEVSFTLGAYADAPGSPYDVRAYPISSSAIELYWRVDQDSGYGKTIERAQGDGPFSVLKSGYAFGGTDYEGLQSFVDDTVLAGETYRYRVSQNYFQGNTLTTSPPSEEAVAQPLPAGLAQPVGSVTSVGGLHPDWLTVVGDSLFFTLNAPEYRENWASENGRSLWVTSGPQATPVQLFDGPVRELIAFGDALYFSGHSPDTGWELYRSDGTAAGTNLVKDIVPGIGGAVRMIAASGSTLYFGVPVTSTGYELWASDGSSAGTRKVNGSLVYLDVAPNTSQSNRRLAAVSGNGQVLYFRAAAADGSDSGQLWRTDGTDAGTARVAGVAHAESLTDLNGTLYLKARTGVFSTDYNPPLHQHGLWKVDPTTHAATLLKAVGPGFANYSFFYRMERVGQQLFFNATSQEIQNEAIWVSDGTAAGTREIYSPSRGNQLRLHLIQDVGGTAYMMGEIGNDGRGRYVGLMIASDGTSRGTRIFRAFDGILHTASPNFAASGAGSYVYSDGDNVWLTQNTRESGRRISTFGTSGDSGTHYGQNSAVLNDVLFFSAQTTGNSRELRYANLTPPSQPSQLGEQSGTGQVAFRSFAAAAATGVSLAWRDNAANENGFLLDRFDDGAQLPTASIRLPENATAYLDPDGNPGDVYRLRAFNAGGYSASAHTGGLPLAADIVDVSPDPRSTGVSAITITFNRKVFGFGTADLSLTRNGGKNLLTGVNRLTTTDYQTFTLTNLAGLTVPGGDYILRLMAAGGPVDGAAKALPADVLESWTNVAVAPTVRKFNFQPAAAPVVSGYLVDAGATFAARNGQTYGWTISHTGAVVDRNKNASQLLDTNVGVLAGGRWELAVPNGTYTVKVGVGDSSVTSRNNVYIEGQLLFNYQQLAANTFASKSITVHVADGRLTMGIGSAASGTTRIDFVEVTSPPASPPPTSPPPPTAAGAKFNFQPASAPAVIGYEIDAGATYGSRNGHTYGWTTSHTDAVVDRNLNSDQLVDTHVGVKAAARWELAVPNGTYVVKVGVGDAGASSTNNIYIEGQNLFNYQQLAANAFASKSITVNVTDGKLTMGIGSAATGTTKIDYIEVASPSSPPPTSPPPTSPPPTSPPPTSPPPPASTSTKINFQPSGATTVSGYLVDAGGTYAARNGKTYGWTVNHTDVVVDRGLNADQLLDTHVAVKQGARWEIAVANGTYTVRVSVGDSGATSMNNVWIEGQQLYNQQSQAANDFSSKSITVNVTDGRLTLGIGSLASGLTKLNYIEIT